MNRKKTVLPTQNKVSPSQIEICTSDMSDLNWLESLLVTKYQVTNRKRVPTNEFRENEQKNGSSHSKHGLTKREKSALPDMSLCLCFTLIADNSSAHHVSTGKLGELHISTAASYPTKIKS